MTNDPEAHRFFLQAQSHIWKGRQRFAIQAVPLLQTAVELDPEFAEAHAILAGLYQDMSLLDQQERYNPRLRRQLATQSLHTALSLKPDSPLVLAKAAQARIKENDDAGALVLAQRALKLDPNNTDALRARLSIEWNRGDAAASLRTTKLLVELEPMSVSAMNHYWNELNAQDKHQDGLAIANRALALYPESEVPQVHSWAAASKRKLGDRVGAIESSRKAMPYSLPLDLWAGLDYDWEFLDELDPWRSASPLVYIEEYDRVRLILVEFFAAASAGPPGANKLDYLVNMGELEALAGNFEMSIEYFEEARSLVNKDGLELVSAQINYPILDWSRQSHFSLALLYAYRNTGQYEKAGIVARQFEDLLASHIEEISLFSDLAEHRYLYKQAQYFALEGRSKEAIEKLQSWLEYKVDLYTYIQWDPFLDSLRGNPEFDLIAARVGAELAEIRVAYAQAF